MNISFFDGVNDGKFYSITADKYDEIGDEDEDIDILDRVSRLEEKYKKLNMDVTSNMENNTDKVNDRMGIIEKKLALFYDILDRVTKLERRCDTYDKLIGDLGRHIVEIECTLSSLSDRVSKLDSKFAVIEKLDMDDILDKISHLEEKVINTQLMMHSIDLRLNGLNELDEKVTKLDIDSADISKKVDEQGTILNNLVFETKFNSNAIVSHCLSHKDKKVGYSWVPKEYDFNSKDRVNDFEKWKKENDVVNHPRHYTQGKYEVIDFIHEYGEHVNIGNSIKYISRAGVKDEDKYVEDLEKALWYLHDYNNPKPKNYINPLDYAKDKKLPDELVAVIIDICKKDYKLAEVNLSDYIKKLKDDANNG